MVTIKKMRKSDVSILYQIALRSFQPDYEKYGVYPPLINLKRKKFYPPLIFGKTIFVEDTIIGGVFVARLGKKGEIGAIFLDTIYQHKGYGKEVISMIEQSYPKIKRWKLETLSENYKLHYFYESLGYIKTGEILDKKSGIRGFIYEKNMKSLNL